MMKLESGCPTSGAEVFLYNHKGQCHPVVDTEVNHLTFQADKACVREHGTSSRSLADHSSEAPINASVQLEVFY